MCPIMQFGIWIRKAQPVQLFNTNVYFNWGNYFVIYLLTLVIYSKWEFNNSLFLFFYLQKVYKQFTEICDVGGGAKTILGI